jgi:ABC-type nickel/cobalt efflux system permease component RcnA/Tol biopolymer transport system component
MMKKFILASLICIITLLGTSFSVDAHPADMYYHTHIITLTETRIEVIWEIKPGPMIAQSIWFEVDVDQDNRVSEQEGEAWAASRLSVISGKLDQESLDLSLDQVIWPAEIDDLFSGETPIRVHLSAQWPADLDGVHELSLDNRFNPKNSISWFEIQAEEGLGFSLPLQNRGSLGLDLGSTGGIPADGILVSWESGSPSIPWVVESVGLGDLAEEAASESRASPAEGFGPASILEGLIKQQEGSLAFILGALVLAALLGSLHALSPGHGKTIVAAYLVGSQGKAYHAFALGAIVTLTHTGSVFALGLITLTASRYFLAADIFPVLELFSGLLILLLGIGLLWPRVIYLLHSREEKKRFQQNNDEVIVEGKRRLAINLPVQEIGPSHTHDPSKMGAIPRKIPGENPLEGIRWRSLIPLAISGGLVPCPDAIAILLVAATINRIGFGLSLILAFSFGLAVILIIVGLLIVQGRKLFERLRWFNRAAVVMPVVSALIVLGVGIVLSVSAIGNIQDQGQLIDPSNILKVGSESNLNDMMVLYTALVGEQRSQLMIVPATGGEPQQITEDLTIWSYIVASDANRVYFASDRGDNGSWIGFWDLESNQQEVLLECPNAYCSELAGSPDGQGLLFSRLDFDPEINPGNIQTIWWLNLDTRDSDPLFQDDLTPGFSPRWSPDGNWLSYNSINPLEIRFYRMKTGESQILPTSLGYPPVWSPDSSEAILLDLEWGEFGYQNKLFLYDLESEWLTMLASEENYDESYPAWSPDGSWLAVVRRAWNEEVPEPNNQVWIMRPDGTVARQLTDTIDYTYGQPAWSPDSRYLVVDYRSLREGGVESGVILIDILSGRIDLLAEPGFRPAWLPGSSP